MMSRVMVCVSWCLLATLSIVQGGCGAGEAGSADVVTTVPSDALVDDGEVDVTPAADVLDAIPGPGGPVDIGPDSQPLVLPPPPTGPEGGVYGYAHGCYRVELFDGDRTVRHVAPGPVEDGSHYILHDGAEGVDIAARFRMRASDLATYLFYDTDRRFLSVDKAGGLARPAELESDVDRLEDGFKSPAEWRLQVSARDPERHQLQHYASDGWLGLDGLTDDEAEAAIVTLHPAEGCADFAELTVDAVGTAHPRTWEDGDAYGIAEIHSHMMADTGFGGGGAFHGAPFHRLGVERALPDCDRSHGEEGRRDLVGYFNDSGAAFGADLLLPVIESGEVGEFNHQTQGYPTFPDWPNSWRRSTHQTMYYRWLERAWLAGLRLLVQHATGNSVLCEMTVGLGAQKTLYSCNDMVSVDRAIAQAHALERYVDAQSGGPGKGWLRVVRTAAEAREVIAQGKLAMILGIEISNIFDCFLTPREGFEACTADSVRATLDAYYEAGVRVIFPVHKYDNAFSAGDGNRGMIELGNFINSGHYSNFVEDCPGLSTPFDAGGVTFGGLNKPRDVYDAPAPVDMSSFVEDLLGTLFPFAQDILEPPLEGNYCQGHGLTELGETLLLELMNRGMIPDLAHLPQRALARAYELLEANDYPAMKTHGHSEGGRIYGIGGLQGSRLGRCSDPNTPGTMGQQFSQLADEAAGQGAYPSEGLRFDLNGFAGGPRPRFGPDAQCGSPQANPITYPFTSYDGSVTFEQPHLGEREVDFNQEGMIHIGLLPELIEDVRRDGVTDDELEPLFRGAEAYLRMWEKAELSAAARSRK